MFRKKKNKRTFDNIGKTRYDFDYQLESIIYKNLCCVYVKKKLLQKLDDKLKFYTYKEWKQYIYTKYSDSEEYSVEKLNEFSRYLNHRRRTVRPSHEYWNILATIVMTLFVTESLDMISYMRTGFEDISFLGRAILILFFSIIVVAAGLFLTWNTFGTIWDSNTEENMLIDYKEIIDDIIKEKE